MGIDHKEVIGNIFGSSHFQGEKMGWVGERLKKIFYLSLFSNLVFPKLPYFFRSECYKPSGKILRVNSEGILCLYAF